MLTTLLATLPSVSAHSIVPQWSTILVDSGNLNKTGPSYHLIRDIGLFTSFDNTIPSYPIVTGNGITTNQGGGTCTFFTENGLLTSMTKCLHVPGLPENLLSVKAAAEQGVMIRFENVNTITFPDGSYVGFSPDTYSLRIRPVTDLLASASVITRGKHGVTHFTSPTLSQNDHKALALWSARFNDPPASVLNSLHKYVKNVPEILRKATDSNTITDAKLLASGRRMPTKTPEEPIATVPGAVTAVDYWSAGLRSTLTGHCGLLSYIDIASSNFKFYPVVSKSEAPAKTEQYYLDAAHDGVNVVRGSVLYSDNEHIFTSAAMADVARRHELVQEHALEYEPWGNGSCESVFRYAPHSMRKMHIRSGLPDDFFPFSALETEDLLNATRVRSGKSCREMWHNKTPDAERFIPWGCKSAVRKPLSYRGNKIEAQNVEAVYLGRARGQPGSVFWCPEYGLLRSSNATYIEDVFPFLDGTMVYTPPARLQSASAGAGGRVPRPAANNVALSDTPPDTESDSSYDPASTDSDSNTYDDSTLSHLSDVTHVDSSVPPSPVSSVSHVEEFDDHALSDAQPHMSDYSEDFAAVVDAPARHTRSAGHVFDQTVFADVALICSLADGSFPQHTHVSDMVANLATMTCNLADGQFPAPWVDISKHPRTPWIETLMAADKRENDGIFDKKAVEEICLSDVPEGTHIFDILTMRKLKRDGTAKSRNCVNGKDMVQGVHYNRSYSPTMQYTSIRALTAVSALHNLTMSSGDFTLAYLHAELKPEEYFYVHPPKSTSQYFTDGIHKGLRKIWKVIRALYGGKGSGRSWFDKVRPWFPAHGYKQSAADPCIFIKDDGNGGIIIVGCYVDDLIICHSNEVLHMQLVKELKEEFDYEDLGRLTNILGTEFAQTPGCITITQTADIEAMAMKHLTDADMLLPTAHVPALHDLPALVMAASLQNADEIDPTLKFDYQTLVGGLLFKAIVYRPDISFSVGLLTRVMEKPTNELLVEAKRVLRYLLHSKLLGIRYARGGNKKLNGMSDSDWSVHKSISGYVFFLAGAAVAFLSKKQPCIAMSSTEAEIMAASLAALEAVYLRVLLSEIGLTQHDPTDLGIDNKGAYDMALDYVSNSKTKHIERRHLKIRELVEEMQVAV